MNFPSTGLGRSLATLAVLAFLLASCGRFARSGTALPTIEPTLAYGADLEFSPEPEGKKGKGRIVIFVLEEGTNRPIEGAIVDYDGPERGEIVTNAGGRARIRVEPGTYDVSLPPCGRTVMITTAAGARLQVPPGTEAGGRLTTTWEHRYTPSPSVQISDDPPWKRREPVTLGVRVQDGCTFREAPGARLPTYAWLASDHYAFLEQPTLTADDTGFLRVTVRCERKGDGDITILDRLNPDDKINLLTAISAPPNGKTYCA